MKTALILEEILGKRAVLMLYSKQPKVRAQAFHNLNHGLSKFDFSQIEKQERQQIFVALFAVLNKGCADNDIQVNMYAIELLLNMMKNHYKNFEELEDENHKKEFNQHVDQIIESLLFRLGSENKGLKEKSKEALGLVSHYPIMNYAE